MSIGNTEKIHIHPKQAYAFKQHVKVVTLAFDKRLEQTDRLSAYTFMLTIGLYEMLEVDQAIPWSFSKRRDEEPVPHLDI